jgi:hypothetical protein
MSAPRIDTGTLAFRQVLAASAAGDQARVDALVSLAQRKLFAATWPGPNQVTRTLTNSDGQTALPLFTGMDSLETTATRFGWRDPDGSLQFRELGAREALRYALTRGVHFVVLDIGEAHSVEFSRDELEPLLQLQAARGHATGPLNVSSPEAQAALLEAVRKSQRPAQDGEVARAAAESGEQPVHRNVPKRPVSQPLTSATRPPSVKPPPVLSANDNVTGAGAGRGRTPLPGTLSTSATARAGRAPAAGRARDGAASASAINREGAPPTRDDLRKHKPLQAPKVVLSDALRLGISAGLRAFPEVEWACVAADDTPIPVIGVRVDPSFLNRVAEITDAILGAADKQGVELQVLLLNNTELVKSAHKCGHAFYPWRK